VSYDGDWLCYRLVVIVCVLTVFLTVLPKEFGYGRRGWMDPSEGRP
jgi:hypothetical protein